MRSLSVRLILAFLGITLLGAALVAVFAAYTTTSVLRGYAQEESLLNFKADVQTYYQEHGSWDGVSKMLDDKAQAAGFPPPPRGARLDEGRPPPPPRDGRPPPPPRHILADQNGIVLVGSPPYRRGDKLLPIDLEGGMPVEVDGQIVGTVLASDNPVPTVTERIYLERLILGVIFAVIIGTIVALLTGIALVRKLVRPLKELTQATQAVAQGELGQQVIVTSKDEVGELALAFNQMSSDLAQANQARRQMTADIAHDLRTPLTVISGYIEALRDGVLQPKPSMFEVMHDEVEHLQRLIEDLRTLSLADAGKLSLNRELSSPQTILKKLAASYQHQASQHDITVQVQTDPILPEINVDPERMAQIMGNLVSNALRYTPEGGKIVLAGHHNSDYVWLEVQDSGAGIAPDELNRIFDRFYRVDESREQHNGESGLGLAIAKSLTEAHGGTLSATSKVGQGTTFIIALPIDAERLNKQ